MNFRLRNYFSGYLGLGLLYTLVSCAYGDGGLQSVPGDEVVQKETRTETQKSRIDPDKYVGLISQIDHAGHARIIVELNLPDGADDSSASIIEAQDQLIRGLADFQYTLVRRYSSLPMLVLEVRRDALDYLLRSPQVKSISPDSLLRPMGNSR